MGDFGYIFGYAIVLAFLMGGIIGYGVGYYQRRFEEPKQIQKSIDEWKRKSRY